MSAPAPVSAGWGRRLLYATLVLGGLSVAADLLYHKHGHYGFEEIVGFHALFGLASSVVIVVVAVLVRRIVMRAEDYYGPADEPEAEMPEDDARA